MYRLLILWLAPILIAILLATGCTPTRATRPGSEIDAHTLALADPPQMAILPLAIHAHDNGLVARIANGFSTLWSRKTDGAMLPVIPQTGSSQNVVRLSSESFGRAGVLDGQTVRDQCPLPDTEYVLALWITDYGISWAPQDLNRKVAIGFSLIEMGSAEIVLEGQSHAESNARRITFPELEAEVFECLLLELATYFRPLSEQVRQGNKPQTPAQWPPVILPSEYDDTRPGDYIFNCRRTA